MFAEEVNMIDPREVSAATIMLGVQNAIRGVSAPKEAERAIEACFDPPLALVQVLPKGKTRFEVFIRPHVNAVEDIRFNCARG